MLKKPFVAICFKLKKTLVCLDNTVHCEVASVYTDYSKHFSNFVTTGQVSGNK